MKKYMLFFYYLFVCLITPLFAFEKIEKKSSTKDGYTIELWQIDKEEQPDSYEFYTGLISNNSKEKFIWCFNTLNKAIEKFEDLKDVEVEGEGIDDDEAVGLAFLVLLGNISLKDAKQFVLENKTNIDRRKTWRKKSLEAEIKNGITIFWMKED